MTLNSRAFDKFEVTSFLNSCKGRPGRLRTSMSYLNLPKHVKILMQDCISLELRSDTISRSGFLSFHLQMCKVWFNGKVWKNSPVRKAEDYFTILRFLSKSTPMKNQYRSETLTLYEDILISDLLFAQRSCLSRFCLW